MSTRVGRDLGAVDPALPRLASAFDRAAAAAVFEQAWGTAVTDCVLLTARFEPGVRCLTTYALVVDDGSGGISTIGVLETDHDSLTPRRFEIDPALPGLARAVDPGWVSAVAGWAACAVETVRYRPEERAVLRYEHGGPAAGYGKVLAGGIRGLVATLEELGRADGDLPVVPAPVVVDDDAGLVVVAGIPGPSLHDVVFGAASGPGERAEAVRRTGRALAGLHGASVVPDRAATPADELRDLGAYLPAAMCADPGAGTRLAALIERAGVGPDDPAVPSHGALRTDQVILASGRPALIDLDGFCAAHPARDLGNLLAYLRWRAVRRPTDRSAVHAARRSLLEGYRRGGPSVDPDALRYYEGISLLKIVGRRYRRLAVDEFALVPELLDAAGELLEAAS